MTGDRMPSWLADATMPGWLRDRQRRPGGRVDAGRMLTDLATAAARIEAKREAQARRHAPQRQAGWAAYQAARERLAAGQRRGGPGPVIGALYGLDDSGPPVRIF